MYSIKIKYNNFKEELNTTGLIVKNSVIIDIFNDKYRISCKKVIVNI